MKVTDGSNRGMPLRRIASRAHWNPNGLPADVSAGIYESTVLSPPTLASPDAEDRVPSAVTYGFVIDLVAVEIERQTGAIRIDKYVSVHDVGRQMNPLIVEGQVHGGFAHGLGAALMEELAYDARGNFLSGTFADYLCPTSMEVPPVTIGHVETPSPMNALGAKGMGDGSSMLTPAAIANAVADALGRDDITLPLTLQRVWALANDVQPAARAAPKTARRPARRRLARRGRGDDSRAARRGVAPADRSDRARRDRAGLRAAAADRARSLHRRGDDRRRRHPRALRGGDRARGQAGAGVGPPRRQGVRRARLRDRRGPGAARPGGRAARGSPTAIAPRWAARSRRSASACSAR